jgi:predicted kinase
MVCESDARPRLVVLIGLQAAGKTTFYRERFAAAHEHVSMDRLRNNRHPARRRVLIAEALAAGRSVVVDNTNPTAEERAKLIALGRAHNAAVIGYYFAPDVRGSRGRNARREGPARVPVVAIHATAKKLQPPSYTEGFDRLYAVRIGPSGAFEVRPLEEPAPQDEPMPTNG